MEETPFRTELPCGVLEADTPAASGGHAEGATSSGKVHCTRRAIVLLVAVVVVEFAIVATLIILATTRA